MPAAAAVHARDDSSDDSAPRKRNRPGLSCHGCRKRKYRCDGRRPACKPCERSKITCVYDGDGTQSKPTTETTNHTSRAAAPPKKTITLPVVSEIEDPLAVVTPGGRRKNLSNETGIVVVDASHATSTSTGFQSIYRPAHSSFLGVTIADLTTQRDFRGSGFQTQFFGFSHSGSFFADFTQVLAYNKLFCDRHPMLLRALGEIRTRQKAANAAQKAAAPKRNEKPLWRFLPSQAKTTHLVNLYLDTIGQCFHVLHLPTFNAQFKKLWEHDLCDADPGVVALVLVMCAAVYCCEPEAAHAYRGTCTVIRDTAAGWVERVDAWLATQSQKHTTLLYFQIRVISMAPRYTVAVKIKRWWEKTGELYRFGIGAGLHLDPSTARLGSKITPFEREMRRRIWAAIEYFELHATFFRGVVPCMAAGAECGPPTNVPDEQLNEDMAALPAPLKHDIYTPVSALVDSRHTFDLRHDVTRFLNSSASETMTQADLLHYEERIMTALNTAPTWSNAVESSTVGRLSVLPVALRRSKLLQALLFLHRRAYDSPAAAHFRYYTRQGVLTAASAIVRQHIDIGVRASILLTSFTGDVYEGAMALCRDICEPDPRADAMALARPPVRELADLAERALNIFEWRINHVCGLSKRYWLLAAAHSLARRIIDPDNADRHELDTSNRIGNVLYKQLTLQVDADSDEPVEPLVKCSGSVPPTVDAGGAAVSSEDPAWGFEELPLFEGSDLPDWNIDEFLGF